MCDPGLDVLDHALADYGFTVRRLHVFDSPAHDFGILVSPRMPVATRDQ